MHPQGEVSVAGVLLFEFFDVYLAIRVITSESFLFDALPIVRRGDRALGVVRYRLVPISGYFSQKAVGVLDDPCRVGLADNLFLKAGVYPNVTCDDVDAIEVEEQISLVVVGDVIVRE